MLKLLGIFISLFLILIIFLQVPQKNAGLSSLATKSNILGSASSTQRFLNILTATAIVVYLAIAVTLNFLNQ